METGPSRLQWSQKADQLLPGSGNGVYWGGSIRDIFETQKYLDHSVVTQMYNLSKLLERYTSKAAFHCIKSVKMYNVM